jgi:hypothetical protein
LHNNLNYFGRDTITLFLGADWINLALSVVASCEYDNELSGPTKKEDFIDFLSNYKFLMNDSAR